MKTRAAVIGLGVGEQHIRGYMQHPECNITAICDTNPEKLQAVSSRYPHIPTTEDPNTILTDPNIDVVSIATYDDVHATQVISALNAGKHVFVEKPLCQTADELAAIQKAHQQNAHLLLGSNLILRTSPRFQWLKNAISQGLLGEIYYIEASYDYGRLHKIIDGWRGQLPFYSVYSGGAIHLVDLIHWLIDDTVATIHASGNAICSSQTRFGQPDLITSTLTYTRGAIASITANYGCVRPHYHGLTVYGTKGTFINQPGDAHLYTSRDPNVQPESITAPYPAYDKADYLADFVEAARTGSTPFVTAADIYQCMSTCIAVDEVLQQQRPAGIHQ